MKKQKLISKKVWPLVRLVLRFLNTKPQLTFVWHISSSFFLDQTAPWEKGNDTLNEPKKAQKFDAAEKIFTQIAKPCVGFENSKVEVVNIFGTFQVKNSSVIPLALTCQKFWTSGNHPARWQHHSVCLVNTKWINLDHRHFIYHYPCYVWCRIRISPVF